MEWFKSYGVTDYGYTEESIPLSLQFYNQWIDKKNHGPLLYMEGERQKKRQNLKNYWPQFNSALVFIFSYHQVHFELQKEYEKNPKWNGLKLASFSLGFSGEDYHDYLKKKLIKIGEKLKEDHDLNYHLILDTQPVMERDLAQSAGLGWFGKNSMLIHREHGSFFLIGSLLLDKKLNYKKNKMENDHCGQCTKCIDACPTAAIDLKTRTIIAKDCISTFTIEEFRLDTIPSQKMDLKTGTIFGCDICQDVCPWNKRIDRIYSHKGKEDFKWNDKQKEILNFFILRKSEELKEDLEKKTNKEYRTFFYGTSFFRSGKRGILKNINLYFKQKLNIFS